jgi:molybdopterin molybdotransferase
MNAPAILMQDSMAAAENIQTITRLTPLAAVLAAVATEVKPVAPRAIDISAAAGRVLATDALAPMHPSAAVALLDGWAVRADETLGAGGYVPVQLLRPPQRVEAGQPMPAGSDSVAPPDAVKLGSGVAEVLITVSPGDGVLAAGGDSDAEIPLRRLGERLRLTDIGALGAAGLTRVSVREPRIRVIPLRDSGIITATARLLASDIEKHGGTVQFDQRGDLDGAFTADEADAIIAIGGTGSGRNDGSVQTLARAGRVAVHGMAVTPGETAALGFVAMRPVLLLPGRLDAALAVWLLVGRRMLQALAGTKDEDEAAESIALARKVTSTVGLAEVVPVRRHGERVEPLASKYLPLSSLTRSHGWILVPADSEGYAAGASVQVRPWP